MSAGAWLAVAIVAAVVVLVALVADVLPAISKIIKNDEERNG